MFSGKWREAIASYLEADTSAAVAFPETEGTWAVAQRP
jgi:hypothetical protein